MGIEEGTFWDEHWVLYGNQLDNKFHILKKKKETLTLRTYSQKNYKHRLGLKSFSWNSLNLLYLNQS